ncbi:MAG: NusG domain II-containing protein [Clostridium sp.]|uniref:NusG domain II-containing protein n=1 Tax=Clostridium sp. TaxID=1506 RepID=UPI001EBEF975|nr:NusG domain II-containing protein [Clostridium sp.]MBS5886443.1 NusG domain II-containing protein [Clostridium sp.]MDU7149963.1 NusG domain II-containing protein [Clostridium sp.]MDU7243192.1 NusG domain II-containing protein [Clostridium sp.]
MFKKLDFVIIAVLMVLSFLPEIILGASIGKGYNNTYAEITIAGKIYKTIPLSEHKGEETIEVKTKDGLNIIKVKDNKIGIIEADCPDKVCMNPEYIEKPGQSLVCLPHRVMIEIKGKIDDDIILSH